jgi:hypothetical protein
MWVLVSLSFEPIFVNAADEHQQAKRGTKLGEATSQCGDAVRGCSAGIGGALTKIKEAARRLWCHATC